MSAEGERVTRDGARQYQRASNVAAPFVAQNDQQLHAQQASKSAVRGVGLDPRVWRRRNSLEKRSQFPGRRILPKM